MKITIDRSDPIAMKLLDAIEAMAETLGLRAEMWCAAKVLPPEPGQDFYQKVAGNTLTVRFI